MMEKFKTWGLTQTPYTNYDRLGARLTDIVILVLVAARVF